MDKIIISGMAPYDGEYEIDPSYLTNGELHRIKKLFGIRAGELDEAMDAGDNDVIVALGLIALERNGIKVAVDDIMNAPFGRISYEPDSESEDDAGPPEVSASGNSSSSTSGPDSELSSENQAEDQKDTGTPESAGAA